MALCFTESSLKYDVVHKGSFDRLTTGLCGIKSYWIDIIPNLTKDNINSLKGGELVLEYLLNKYDGDLFNALKDYKGAKNNLEPVHRVIRIYEDIR